MKHFFLALFRSFFRYLFLTVVCSAVITVVMFPPIGRLIAADLCEGHVESELVSWSMANGEFGESANYYCSSGETRVAISNKDMIYQTAVLYIGFITAVIWPLLFLYALFFSSTTKRTRTKATESAIYLEQLNDSANPSLKLHNLRFLFEEGLISEDEYERKRQEILASFECSRF